MAFISHAQVFKALEKLEDPAVQREARCDQPRANVRGETARPLKVARDRIEEVPYGAHDADFLVIDPETLEVRCGACSGDLDVTVPED